MSREIILRSKNTRPRELTRQEAERIDREQPNRKRLPSPAMNDFWAMMSMVYWIRDIIENPHMREIMQDMGVLKRFRTGATMLYNCCQKSFTQISAAQLRTIDANLGERVMTISANERVSGFINVDADVLNTLVVATLKNCREGLCLMDEKEAAKCPVKQALDLCLSMSQYLPGKGESLGACPYSTMDLGEETA